MIPATDSDIVRALGIVLVLTAVGIWRLLSH
jgi:hypothetical protein